MNEAQIQHALQKMTNLLHLFHTSLHDFNMVYIDSKMIDHIIYDDSNSNYRFDSPQHPLIESEDLDEINEYFQDFLDDKYYSFFTVDQVADIIDSLDITKGTENISKLSVYLDEHPNQVYRLYGHTNGLVTDISSAKRTFAKEDLEITHVDHYILDDGDGEPYGEARGYPYRELLKYRDSGLFNIFSA